MKIVCVTAICGGFDNLIESFTPSEDVEFVCFTDNPNLTSQRWTLRAACTEFIGCWDANVRNAKRHKVMIHEYFDCDISVWVDGHVRLIETIPQIVGRYLKEYDIATFRHPGRICAYKEMDICLELGLDKEEIMRAQMQKYAAEGFPHDYGLNAGGLILRRHTEEVKRFNELWWSEICQHSKRDQLSLNYCLWKTGLKMGELDDYWCSKIRVFEGHGR